MEIIPAILESEWSEVGKKIKMVYGSTDWIQLDVSDGQFTDNKTWSNPHDLFGVKLKFNPEVHLMINNPWESAESWLSSPAKRIVVQVEAFSSPESVKFGEILFTAKKYGKEVAWGFKLETAWEPYKELMQDPHARVLFLSVEPGRQGQEFNPDVLEKIKSLKAAHPHVKIAVDGGINLKNIESIKLAGADSAVIGSGIFGVVDPIESIKKFQQV